MQAYRRRMGTERCEDVMTREPISVQFGTPLQEAWVLLREHHIKALPVVDRARRLIGIVTLADFMRGADIDMHEGWATRLRALLRPTPHSHSDKPEVVGQIMNARVRVASFDRPLAELVPIFAASGHHHIPDHRRRAATGRHRHADGPRRRAVPAGVSLTSSQFRSICCVWFE